MLATVYVTKKTVINHYYKTIQRNVPVRCLTMSVYCFYQNPLASNLW